jgi:hypothetical protein
MTTTNNAPQTAETADETFDKLAEAVAEEFTSENAANNNVPPAKQAQANNQDITNFQPVRKRGKK